MDKQDKSAASHDQTPPSPSNTGSSDSSHVSPPGRPPHSTGFPWSSWPSVHVMRPQNGQYSPRTDERCLSYCSQSSRGRAEGNEPWCRSICLRRVFAHEVKRVVAHDNASKLHGASSRLFPLPPEGQPGSSRPLRQDPGHFSEDHELSPPYTSPEDTRYWEEGWYLWTSKSRWAAQEKFDLMTCDLHRQDQWQRYKTDKSKQEPVHRAYGNEGLECKQRDKHCGNGYDVSAGMSSSSAEDSAKWVAWQESTMVHLPPRLPSVYEPLNHLLAPTFKVISLIGQSFDSGVYAQLAQRTWEKARSPDPFILAENVCKKMWEKWKEGPPDDADSEF
ncbi:hypothetical protein SERLA73DRAFT_105438 [Serpula lacrymans var. lacrymans S7.3]|uniref:Uncharacterized protein n=2 Tax=Serpula lacrymans var. lacrymans TaxID=341189 RepID=F8PTB4_SERL3|nr:uncharacterized protein SERLADRAFT_463752 [Serpula lacrymans var. lacrymans S7.9]EGO00944.1 hypothetical protein SERLA73DRAFT_105438 [Serpula lacrymans var. lacrymans S7.3]EGO26563.1 hypothetical protein SERLADRAFT_463752 [Serpula lacrymans var. lacrymans S7.9]